MRIIISYLKIVITTTIIIIKITKSLDIYIYIYNSDKRVRFESVIDQFEKTENPEKNNSNEILIKNLIKSIEKNLDTEFQEFNKKNCQIDCTICTVEKKFQSDTTLKKFTKKFPNLYKSSFNNKKYSNTYIQRVYNKHENSSMDKKTFVQILEKIFE